MGERNEGRLSNEGAPELSWRTARQLHRRIAEREDALGATIEEDHPNLLHADDVSNHDVVYLRENRDWIHGLPFGNGDVGGVVCFDTNLHVYLDKTDLWYDVGTPGLGETGVDHYGGLRGGRIHAGLCTIQIPWLTQCDSVEQRLDLRGGCIRVRATREAFTIAFTITAHAHENRIRIAIDHPETVDFFPRLDNFDFDLREQAAQSCALERSLGRQSYRVELERNSLGPGSTAYDIAIVTTMENQDSAGAVASDSLAVRARELLERPWDQQAHEQWWQRFWSKSSVHVPDKFLENEWYLCQYVTAITNRAQYPASFSGLWCFTEPVRMWGDLYVTDAQHPMGLWSVMPCNHLELIGPYLELYRDLQDALEQATRDVLEPGSTMSVVPNTERFFLSSGEQNQGLAMPKFVWPPWSGIDHPEHGLAASMKRGEKFTAAGSWIAKLFWQYYQHSGDIDFLREVAYPFMKSAMLYIEGTLSRDEQGRIYDSSESPEQHGNTGSAFGRSLVRMLLSDCLEAATVLDVDGNERRRWQDTLGHLAPYALAADGGIAESYTDEHPFRAHMSVLFGAYPAREIDPEHPLAPSILKTVDTATRFYANRDPGHGGLLVEEEGGADLNIFNQTVIALVLARMGRGGEARNHLYNPTLRYLLLPHGGWAHNPGHRGRIAAETTGLPALGLIINEMMLQLRDSGEVVLFPALPDDWEDAAFSRLRVEGGLVVSAERRSGRVAWVRLSAAYDTEARLRNPFDQGYRFLEDAAADRRADNAAETLSLRLRAGETLTLVAEGAAGPPDSSPAAAAPAASAGSGGAVGPAVPAAERPPDGAEQQRRRGPRWFSVEEVEHAYPIVVAPKPPPHEVQDFGDGRRYIGMPEPAAGAARGEQPRQSAVDRAMAALDSQGWQDRQRALIALARAHAVWATERGGAEPAHGGAPSAAGPESHASRVIEVLLRGSRDPHELVRATAVSTMKYVRHEPKVYERLEEVARDDRLEAGRRAKWILAEEPEDTHR